ncbi:hypothetical protein CC2G_007926 [Coprinopsis cinerea AmutBmut pab1-1]|nr:hypothetical protein CC2G_007926 [Coprinopsis cinerea AmutBmut pab1-1]
MLELFLGWADKWKNPYSICGRLDYTQYARNCSRLGTWSGVSRLFAMCLGANHMARLRREDRNGIFA